MRMRNRHTTLCLKQDVRCDPRWNTVSPAIMCALMCCPVHSSFSNSYPPIKNSQTNSWDVSLLISESAIHLAAIHVLNIQEYVELKQSATVNVRNFIILGAGPFGLQRGIFIFYFFIFFEGTNTVCQASKAISKINVILTWDKSISKSIHACLKSNVTLQKK